MTAFPQTFEQWRDLAQSGPEAVATAFYRHLETLPEQGCSAALAWTAPRAVLEQEIAQALASNAPLAGLPTAFKDLFAVANVPTCAGSSFFAELTPPPSEDGGLVREARGLGLSVAAKTHLNEFAYGLSGLNQWTGDCPNPRNPRVISGGSSSGSAWAVGAGVCPIAFGTDTGGSIRVPAAWCGLFGFRTPPNRWTEDGCVPLSPTLDSPGWFTRTAADMREACQLLLGPRTEHTPTPEKLRGVFVNDLVEDMEPRTTEACQRMANRLGAEFDPETAAWLRHGLSQAEPAYAIIQSREAYRVHAQWLDTHRERYSQDVWALIDRGRNWNRTQIKTAEETAMRIAGTLEDYFQTFDVLYLPAVPASAPTGQQMTPEYKKRLLRLNTPASLSRLPVLTVPVPLSPFQSCGLQAIFPSIERAHLTPLVDRL